MILDNEKYIKVRGAQAQGARTVKEVKDMTNIDIEDDDEYREIDRVLQNVCKCQNVSVNEVVEAVKNKKFHIYAVSTIEEGIEVLTGVPAGKKDKDGKFPAGTVNYLV